MRKSIIDLLKQDLDLVKEYNRLYKMFKENIFYSYDCNFDFITLYYAFDKNISKWKHRATYTNLDEVLEN